MTDFWDLVGRIALFGCGVFLWTAGIYTVLYFLITGYEDGKDDEDPPPKITSWMHVPSTNVTYLEWFSFRLAVSPAIIIEGWRFGGGWPTLLCSSLGITIWFLLLKRKPTK